MAIHKQILGSEVLLSLAQQEKGGRNSLSFPSLSY